MPDPTFIIIGAQKCGTTWLSQMLMQHPEIYFTPVKELNFFNKKANYIKGIEWYRDQFKDARNYRSVGESTANYFWTSNEEYEIRESGRTQNIPALVHKHYPDMKFILILRDPVERAISAYYHHIRDRTVSPRTKILDVLDHFGILTMGFYDIHMERWLEYFNLDQFLILIYEEDICRNKSRTLKRVARYLDVSDDFKPNELNRKYNSREGHLYMHVNYVSPIVAKGFKYLIPSLMAQDIPKIKISPVERQTLVQRYASHNQRLEKLIGMEVPWIKMSDTRHNIVNFH